MRALLSAVCVSLLLAAPALAHEGQQRPPAAAPKPVTAPAPVPQHSGGTDSKGCHTNHATGDYHCHKPK